MRRKLILKLTLLCWAMLLNPMGLTAMEPEPLQEPSAPACLQEKILAEITDVLRPHTKNLHGFLEAYNLDTASNSFQKRFAEALKVLFPYGNVVEGLIMLADQLRDHSKNDICLFVENHSATTETLFCVAQRLAATTGMTHQHMDDVLNSLDTLIEWHKVLLNQLEILSKKHRTIAQLLKQNNFFEMRVLSQKTVQLLQYCLMSYNNVDNWSSPVKVSLSMPSENLHEEVARFFEEMKTSNVCIRKIMSPIGGIPYYDSHESFTFTVLEALFKVKEVQSLIFEDLYFNDMLLSKLLFFSHLKHIKHLELKGLRTETVDLDLFLRSLNYNILEHFSFNFISFNKNCNLSVAMLEKLFSGPALKSLELGNLVVKPLAKRQSLAPQQTLAFSDQLSSLALLNCRLPKQIIDVLFNVINHTNLKILNMAGSKCNKKPKLETFFEKIAQSVLEEVYLPCHALTVGECQKIEELFLQPETILTAFFFSEREISTINKRGETVNASKFFESLFCDPGCRIIETNRWPGFSEALLDRLKLVESNCSLDRIWHDFERNIYDSFCCKTKRFLSESSLGPQRYKMQFERALNAIKNKNSTLEFLKIEGKLNDTMALSLAEALTYSSITLETLDLSEARFSEAALISILEGLQHFKSVRIKKINMLLLPLEIEGQTKEEALIAYARHLNS